jgi:hypothetical protein
VRVSAVHRDASDLMSGRFDLAFELHGEQHFVLDDHDIQFPLS